MPPVFIECPLSNGVSLLLAGTTVAVSGGFGEAFCFGEDLKMLVLSVIDVMAMQLFI